MYLCEQIFYLHTLYCNSPPFSISCDTWAPKTFSTITTSCSPALLHDTFIANKLQDPVHIYPSTASQTQRACAHTRIRMLCAHNRHDAHTHTLTLTHTQTDRHRHTNTRTYKHTHTQTHTHMHTQTQTQAHKHTHTDTRTHTQKHRHTRMWIPS